MKNKPGEPIVTRQEGAVFYCVKCHARYQDCQCLLYVSADTPEREIHPSKARQGAVGKLIKPLYSVHTFKCLSCDRPMHDAGKRWECICGFFYKPETPGTIPEKYRK